MNAYPHLRIDREQLINQRRPRGGYGKISPPPDIAAHGKSLQESFYTARGAVQEDIGGFDERCLFKLQIGSLPPDDLVAIPGVELVSQEEGGFALAFADEQALEAFEARLLMLSMGQLPTRKEIFYALHGFDHWTPEDRTGWALKRDGMPSSEPFMLDVELWPLTKSNERTALIGNFETWLSSLNIEKLDSINVESLVLYRVKVSHSQIEQLLHHRDVRTVDLPPQTGLEPQVFALDIQDLPEIPEPPADAPVVGVLDSGIAGGHPLIKSALGDAQGFLLPGKEHHDDNGHGTQVAGIALYDDVETCTQAKSFVPLLRIVSGRILDTKAESDPRFIENIIEEAVRYFYEEYNCRIFNLSYGDLNKPYLGGHVRGLAYVLDRLSRELDVLFVVPTGNFLGTESVPSDWKDEYPGYLFAQEARLLDPAPALNVLTVGSLARWDKSSYAQRYPQDPREAPIAQRDQPSPFSRCGMSVKEAVKPDLAAYGGNWSLNLVQRNTISRCLGELSLCKDFAKNGRLLTDKEGTSFAAPHVAHYAGRLRYDLPDAGTNLLRALLVANAEVPQATRDLFKNERKKIIRAVGYGAVRQDTLYRSTEEEVSLTAEAAIPNNHHHFYEIPIPECFYGVGRKRRLRKITVSLAHCPPVRTTRIDYKASRIEYRLVEGESLDQVASVFNAATSRKDFPNIPELKTKHDCSSTHRSKGTVQCATWQIKQPRDKKLFVVVTRRDPAWGSDLAKQEEPYALVIRLSDRENEQARLYTEIRAQLQIRERARQRLRT